ncbi:MAG: phosphoserine phosphatase SerB [Rhodobacteraceae bacterium]|nr:phosphoserine phosphatase SerB [Paracoccaceae bacterium]
MFLVLTSAQGVSDDVVAEAIKQLADAEAPRRLSANAVEVRFRGARPNFALAGVDVNVVPAANRLKKLLIADMDSTIIPVECIDELADFAGLKAEVSEITERAMQGALDFEAAIDARVGLLAGMPETVLQQCYDERITLNPGARILVKTMNAQGAMTALVSGGFTFFTEKVAEVAGFRMNRANSLEIVDGALSGKVIRPILGREAKLESLNGLCAEQGISAEDVIAVGDGANDLMMVEAAGLGVAYKAKPALAAKADVVLNYSDLTALLALQGLAEANFA